jgi:hypothetical protein
VGKDEHQKGKFSYILVNKINHSSFLFFLFFKSLNWLYPDKYKMNFDNRNRMLIFIEKYTGNQTLDDSSDIRKEFAIVISKKKEYRKI